MLLNYVQNEYKKNMPGARLTMIMIPRVNIISGKAKVASANRAGESGGILSPSAEVLGGAKPPKKIEISLGIAIGTIFSKILGSFRSSFPEVFDKKTCL